MPLNTELKLPSKLKWLVLTQLLVVSLIISFVIALFGGRSAGVGVFIFFTLLIVLPLWLYKLVAFKRVSFMVTDGTLTINSGILVRRSNAISFAQIQNISNTKGPLAAMFNLAELNVWTASPAQMRVQKNRTEHRPTGMLWLETANAVKGRASARAQSASPLTAHPTPGATLRPAYEQRLSPFSPISLASPK